MIHAIYKIACGFQFSAIKVKQVLTLNITASTHIIWYLCSLSIYKNQKPIYKYCQMSESFFQMLSRVYTFSIGSWPYIDNQQMCPYRLAQMGYLIIKPYTLSCSVCHNRVQVPHQLGADLDQTIAQLSKHKSNCLFLDVENTDEFKQKSAISKQLIYLRMDQLVAALKPETNVLNQRKFYPALNQKEIEEALGEEKFTFRMISDAYKWNYPSKIKISSFLQFFGWKITIQSSSPQPKSICAECVLCGRKVNFSNTKIKSFEIDEQPRQLNLEQQQTFNLVSEHRYFCLWINPKCSNYKGYTILTQHHYNKIGEVKSLFSKRPPQQGYKIRVEMDKFLSNFQAKTNQQFQKIKAVFKQCESMKKSIESQSQKGQQNIFEKGQRSMQDFNSFFQSDFREPLKKMKI